MANEQRKMGKLRAIFLPSDLDEALRAEAEKRHISLSWILREALIIYLSKCGHEVATCINPTSKGERTDLNQPFDRERATALLKRIGEILDAKRMQEGIADDRALETWLYHAKTLQLLLGRDINNAVFKQLNDYRKKQDEDQQESTPKKP